MSKTILAVVFAGPSARQRQAGLYETAIDSRDPDYWLRRGGAPLSGRKQLAIFVDGSRRRKSLGRPFIRATPVISPMTPEKR